MITIFIKIRIIEVRLRVNGPRKFECQVLFQYLMQKFGKGKNCANVSSC